MYLLNPEGKDYNKEIAPFLRNGVIIDTCVLWDFICGLISTRFTRTESPAYKKILESFDFLKLTNSKLFITPHILTEISRKLKEKYRRWGNYKDIISEIMPMFKQMEERSVKKNDFIGHINFKNPIIEAGDISIYVVADDFMERKEKIAILSIDGGIGEKYQSDQNVMVIDYRLVPSI